MAEATLILRLLAKGGARARAEIARLGEALRKLKARAKAAGRGVQEAGDKARAGASGFSRLIKQGRVLLAVFAGVRIVVAFGRALLRAAEAASSLLKGARDASVALTGIQITLRAATGSLEEYFQANLKAGEIARRYGVDLQTTAKGLADFLAATQTSNLVFSEQIAIFESLVRAGRVLNLSNERIKLSILAIGQIASKGALQMEELKRQLESIPGAVPRLAKALGITVPELFKQVEAGAVGAERGLRGLRKVFDEISAEQAVASMRTLAAELGRLQVELSAANVALGDASDEGMRKLAEAGTQASKDLQPLATALGELTSDTLLPVSAAVTKVAGDLTVMVARMIETRESSLAATLTLAKLFGLDATPLVATIDRAEIATGLFSKTLAGLTGIDFLPLVKALDLIASKERTRRLEEFTAKVRDLQKQALAGEIELAGGFEKTNAARQEAINISEASLQAVLEGNRSIAESERDLRAIFITKTREERLAAEIAKLEDDAHLARIQERINAETKLQAKLLNETEIARQVAAEREAALSQIVALSKVSAEAQIEDSRRLREAIANDTSGLVAEQLELFHERTAGAEVAAEDRKKIERALTEKLIEIEAKFQEDSKKLREEARKATFDEPEKRLEIEKKFFEDRLALEVKKNEDVSGLLDDLTKKYQTAADKRKDLAKKASDAEIKEAERSAKRQLKLLEELERGHDDLDAQRRAARGQAFEGGDVTGPSVTGGDTSSLADLESELAALDEKIAAGTDTFEEFNRRFKIFSELIPEAKAGLGSFGDDLVAISENNLKKFQSAAKEAASFVGKIGDAGARSDIRLLRDEIAQVADAGNLTGFELDRALGVLQDIRASAAAGIGDAGLPQLGKDAAAAEPAVSKVAEQLEAAGAAVLVVGDGASEAGIKITNLGEKAEEAGGGVQILEDAEGNLVITQKELATSAGEAAQKEQDLADAAGEAAENIQIPEEAIASIERLKEALGGLDPVLAPLETLSATFKSLSETLPLLPEPLQQVVTSLIELIEKEVLGPLAEGFTKLNEQVKPLSEKLPVVAAAQVEFNQAAIDSEEAFETYEAGLKKVTEEELLKRLTTLSEKLSEINAAAVKLGEEGFEAAETGADDFKEAVEELQVEVEELAEFIAGDMSDALFQHAGDWRGPIDIVEVYGEKIKDIKADLEELANSVFPAVADSAEESMQRVSAAVANAAREVEQLLDGLRRAADLSETL